MRRRGSRSRFPTTGRHFIADVFGHRETLICLGRKNAKSAIVAAYLLGRLVGPIRFEGYRGGVASLSREKAGELKAQMSGIAAASDLSGDLQFRRSPAPGRVESKTGTVDFLASDRKQGHASGFDDAVVDELGLFAPNARGLVNGLRSSVSAKNGRFIALSVWGDSPFIPEIVDRRNDPDVAVHLFQPADDDCALDDRAAWAAANPGLASGIKSLAYMEAEARRVILTPADQSDFRAYDLNLPQTPSKEMICSLADWKDCLCRPDDLPEASGRVWVGWDMGGSASLSAFTAAWENGRLECWGAFPDKPLTLAERGKRDGCGSLYVRAHESGELALYSGRIVPAGEFLADCFERLSGSKIVAVGFDRYRRAEAEQAIEQAGIRCRIEPRGAGASAVADGSHDVRAFQRAILKRAVRISRGLLLTSAIAESEIDRDARGNPAISKRKANARIDALSASVIALGIREKLRSARVRPAFRSAVVA